MPKLLDLQTDGTRKTYEGKVSSAGATDAGQLPALNSQGKLDPSFMPNGVGEDAISVTAGEDLAAGDFVYIDASGTALKADASAIGKQARGYVNEGVVNGAQATIFFDDTNSGLTGLTSGGTYYLSAATAGAVTTTAPIASGEIVQRIGFASNATTLRVDIEEPVLLS